MRIDTVVKKDPPLEPSLRILGARRREKEGKRERKKRTLLCWCAAHHLGHGDPSRFISRVRSLSRLFASLSRPSPSDNPRSPRVFLCSSRTHTIRARVGLDWAPPVLVNILTFGLKIKAAADKRSIIYNLSNYMNCKIKFQNIFMYH